jgi:hypothetical protein
MLPCCSAGDETPTVTELRIALPHRGCSGACLLLHSGRSPLLDATFRSTAPRTGLATDPRNRVNVPGLHLRSNPQIRSGPFGSVLPNPFGLLMTSRARSIYGTRCPTRPEDSWLAFGLRLPSGISQSLGIKALNPTSNHKTYPCRLPDLPSLPAAR